MHATLMDQRYLKAHGNVRGVSICLLAFMIDCLVDMHGKHSVEKECHTGSGSRHDQVPFHQ